MKRFLLILLAICTVLALGQTAFADDGVTFTCIGTQCNCTASHSCSFSESAGKIFDENKSTKMRYSGFSGDGNLCEFSILAKASEAVKLTGYTITTANDHENRPAETPCKWEIYGKTEYTDWVLIDSREEDTSAMTNSTDYTYTVTGNDAYYDSYMIKLLKNGGSEYVQLAELTFSSYEHCTEHSWDDDYVCTVCNQPAVARIGTNGYTNLDLTFSAVSEGDKVVILRNTTAGDILISKNCTLDLNGCVITGDGDRSAFKVEENCSLTVNDSNSTAKHGGDTPDGGVIIGGNSFLFRTGASVTLNSGTIGIVDGSSGGGDTFIMHGGAVKGIHKVHEAIADGGRIEGDINLAYTGDTLTLTDEVEVYGNIHMLSFETTFNANGGVVNGYVRTTQSASQQIKSSGDNMTHFLSGIKYLQGKVCGGIYYSSWDFTDDAIEGKTITFMSGEDEYAIEVVGEGNTSVKPIDPNMPAKTDYVIAWFTEKECENEYKFGSAVGDNITLYAGYKHANHSDEEPDHYCDVCGEKFSDHDYSVALAEEQYKASDADCTHKATYYYSCACGEYGTETFEHGEALGHSLGNWIYNRESHWNKCARCGELPEYAEHNFTEWDDVYGEKNKEVRRCTVCGYEQFASTISIGTPSADKKPFGEQNPNTGAPVMTMAPLAIMLGAAALLKKHK